MRHLVNVERSSPKPGYTALYLSYVKNRKVARTIEVTPTCSIAIDIDAEGVLQGIELLNPGGYELELLTKLAHEHDLSLDGLFAFA